ncbi:MAG: DUF2207 domain-containing protein [bacterium]|nr:DUF2207 domain-containing protein [bacterium]
MNNSETKYKNTKLSLSLIILLIIFYILFPIALIYGIIKIYKMPLTETGIFQTVIMKIIILFILIFLLCFMVSGIIGNIVGSLKGKTFINKENKIIKKTNPYIYYRELPNDYGIGVTSLLFDSKIENYKDIIAVILDLCAKKYLSLIKGNDKYYIKILKSADNKLLSNEKFILDLIISKNIKNINYSEWYNYCLQDGADLGLYYHYENPKEVINDGLVTKKQTDFLNKIHRNICLFIGLFVFIIALIAGRLVEGIFYSLVAFAVSYIVLIILFYVINLFTAVLNIGKTQKNITYDITLNNHLKRTRKGAMELQKLISFKHFLSDFGNFVDKHPEEVILWDRYLSYAQVFGLTKEIMSSGYKQLIDNSSFQIDNINNITIYNIEVEK